MNLTSPYPDECSYPKPAVMTLYALLSDSEPQFIVDIVVTDTENVVIKTEKVFSPQSYQEQLAYNMSTVMTKAIDDGNDDLRKVLYDILKTLNSEQITLLSKHINTAEVYRKHATDE